MDREVLHRANFVQCDRSPHTLNNDDFVGMESADGKACRAAFAHGRARLSILTYHRVFLPMNRSTPGM
jgi:hypothetical protein